MEVGTSQEKGILEGAKRSVGICWNLLKAREQMSTPASAQYESTHLSDTATQQADIAAVADANGEVNLQDPGFVFNNIDFPESWLFTDWDLVGD